MYIHILITISSNWYFSIETNTLVPYCKSRRSSPFSQYIINQFLENQRQEFSSRKKLLLEEGVCTTFLCFIL